MRTPHEARILATKQHLESLVQASIDATNARNFEPDSLPWAFCAPYFEASSPNLIFIWGRDGHIQSKEAHLAIMRDSAERNPEFQVRILEMDTLLDERQEHGTVYVKLETMGIVPGVTMKGVLMLSFVKSQDSWWCTHADAVRGID